MITVSAAGRALAGAGLAACLFATLDAPAFAEDMSFIMNNGHPYRVQVELYSQDRDHVWPGHGQAYILDDDQTKEIPISCEAGETICYGAWVDGDSGTYWGVGPDNTQNCDDCCYTCEGGLTEDINLVE